MNSPTVSDCGDLPIIEGRDRSSETAKRSADRAKRFNDVTEQITGGTERTGQKTEPDSLVSEKRALEAESIFSQLTGVFKGTDIPGGTIQSEAAEPIGTDGLIDRESRAGFTESGEIQISSDQAESELVAGAPVLHVRGSGPRIARIGPDVAEDPQSEYYESGFGEGYADSYSGRAGLRSELDAAELPYPESIEIFEMPPIQLLAPRMTPNENLIADFKEMMNQSLRARGMELSDRAEFILNNQLRTDASTAVINTLDNSIIADRVASRETVEQQLTEHTSMLKVE